MAAEQARTLANKLNYKKGQALYYRTMTFFQSDYSLYTYFNLKAKCFYRNIHESEEIPNRNHLNFSQEIMDKKNEQLLKDLPFLEKEQNNRAITRADA